MVNGLSLFKKRFQSFNDCYTVIGGTACSVLMKAFLVIGLQKNSVRTSIRNKT